MVNQFTLYFTADGGYDSDSEEADEADESANGANEVKDDALQAFTAHTGIPKQSVRFLKHFCHATLFRSC